MGVVKTRSHIVNSCAATFHLSDLYKIFVNCLCPQPFKGKNILTMLVRSSSVFRSAAQVFIRTNIRRNIASSTVALNPAAAATDPIQKLFADKVGEYAQKSNAVGGKLVEASPEVEARLIEELEKVANSYGGGKGVNMTEFPVFNFTDPKLDTIDLICDENFCRKW